MCFSRRQTTLQRRWPLPIPITRVNRSGIPKCDQTSIVAPVKDKLGIVHVIVVTPNLIDPILDIRRRLDCRASFMCGPTSVVAHTHYPEKTNDFPTSIGLFVPISLKWKYRRSGHARVSLPTPGADEGYFGPPPQ